MCPMFIDKSNQYNHPYWKPKLLSVCVLALCVCVCVCVHTHVHAWMHVCVHVLTQLHPTLCDPRDCGPPGSSVHVILQARILEWVAISYSKGSSQPREQTQVTCIVRQILYHCAAWEACVYVHTGTLTHTQYFTIPLKIENAFCARTLELLDQEPQVRKLFLRYMITWLRW